MSQSSPEVLSDQEGKRKSYRIPRRRSPSSESRNPNEGAIRSRRRSPSSESKNSNEGAIKSRRRSPSGESRNSNEAAINDPPLTITWTRVEKLETSSGEKMYPSGTPRLTADYRDVMGQIEEYSAIKKSKKKDGLLEEPEKNCADQKTLTLNFASMKKDFKYLEDWATDREKFESSRRIKGAIIVVEKWPEPEFFDESANKPEDDKMTTESVLSKQGMKGVLTIEEKKRWHHRSRYEAVYERQAEPFDQEKERKRRMVENSRPINANMEAIGQRVKSEPEQPRENMPSTSMDRNSRESFQRTPRRSPSREQRNNHPERKELEHRRNDGRHDGRENGYSDERGNKRQEREGYDRCRGVEDKENIRDRSPRGYGDCNRSPNRHSLESDRSFRSGSARDIHQDMSREKGREYEEHNRNRDRSPRSRHDDRGPRTPPAKEINYKKNSTLRDDQQMRMNDSRGSRDGGHYASSTSRRDGYENESRRDGTTGNYGYVKRER